MARRHKADATDAVIESHVELLRTGDGGFQLAVKMDVTLPTITEIGPAREIVAAAHQVCPYSNATRGNIDVEFTVNGEPLEA